MRTLAIIGTAGRKEDRDRLHLSHWEDMFLASKKVVELEGADALVSGGAAWADHVAIRLHLETKLPLYIFLPYDLKDLNICQYYHTQFSRVVGYDTWAEVLAQPHMKIGNFFGRNTEVAKRADTYLAATFGSGRVVKAGGTLDTVRKMGERGVYGYHLDLHTCKLYKTHEPTY